MHWADFRSVSGTGGRCLPVFVCREVVFEGHIFFTTCAELECPGPLECNELGIVQGRGGVARCAGPSFTRDTKDFIRSLLSKIDD